MKVKDAMSTRIMFVKKDATVAQAMRLMAENNMRRLMVKTADESVYGAVTVRDMISKIIAAGADPEKTSVETIMNTALVSVKPSDELKDVAKIMDQYNIAGMPVFDGKVLVGVITMWDILIALGVHGKAS